jgi:hypothetical protein
MILANKLMFMCSSCVHVVLDIFYFFCGLIRNWELKREIRVSDGKAAAPVNDWVNSVVQLMLYKYCYF